MGLCAGIGLRGGRKQGRRSGVSEIRSAIGLSKENRHPKEKKKKTERERRRESLCVAQRLVKEWPMTMVPFSLLPTLHSWADRREYGNSRTSRASSEKETLLLGGAVERNKKPMI